MRHGWLMVFMLLGQRVRVLHATAARAVSRARRRRRGRLERGRLAALLRTTLLGGRPMVGCLGGLFAWPPRIASDPGRCGATSSSPLRPTARRAAVRRAVGRWRRLRRDCARSTALCVAPRWGREGRAAAACVRRLRGARPQTRRRNRAHRAGRAALARVAARVLSVWFGLCVRANFLRPARLCDLRCMACGGRADRRAASAARPPRVVFAFGFDM